MLAHRTQTGPTGACPFVFALIALTGWASADVARPAHPLPTQEEVHQLFDQQQYRPVLQAVARLMLLRGDAASGYDYHDLLRIKAEAHLRLREYEAAERAFRDAADRATDAAQAGVDLSTSVLVRRSRGGQYQPTAKVAGKTPGPISLTDPDLRVTAMQALFRDELAVDGPKIKAVRDARSIDPICAVAPLVTNLQVLETGATQGRDDQTRELIAGLAKNAGGMMGDKVHEMAELETQIVNRANQQIQYYVPTGPPGRGYNQLMVRNRGYDAIDLRELGQYRAVSAKIAPAARAIGNAMGPDGADLVRTSITAYRLATEKGP